MRSLSEIQQANKEFEDRDKAGDFDEEGDGVNRCRECGEEVEDCECRGTTLEELNLTPDGRDREQGGGTVQP